MKKVAIKIICIALGLLAWISSFIGCMEYMEMKNYFGLREDFWFVFALFFSLFVGFFSYIGFKEFIASLENKDGKK